MIDILKKLFSSKKSPDIKATYNKKEDNKNAKNKSRKTGANYKKNNMNFGDNNEINFGEQNINDKRK